MKAVKWTIFSLLMLVALLIGAVGIIIATLDPNDYKSQIESQVKKAIDRDLSIEGEMSWSLFPWLGLNLGKTSLSNAPGFGEDPFASLERVDVQVALLPLLKKQIQTSKLVLHGAMLNLERDEDGKDNWSDLLSATTDEAGGGSQTPDSSTGEGQISLQIGAVDISDASLTLDDRQAGRHIEVKPLNLSTGELVFGEPVDVTSDFELAIDGLTIAANVAGSLVVDPDLGRYSVNRLVSSQTVSGASIPGGSLSSAATMDIQADMKAGQVKISGLSLDALDLALQGDAEVSGLDGDAPRLGGHLSTNTFNPRALLTRLGVTLPVMNDPSALGSAALTFDLSGSPNAIRLSALTAKLDSSVMSGQAALADIASQQFEFDLVVDKLDLDRYFPAPVKASDPPTERQDEAKRPAEGSDEIALPIEALRALSLKGKATVEELKIHRLTFNNASVSVAANAGKLSVSPLSARAYGGRVDVTAGLDVAGKTPAYSAQLGLKGVRSGDILDILFQDRIVSGVMNLDADVDGKGSTFSALKRSLSGAFQAKFSEGTIRGSKLAGKIIEAENFLRKFDGRAPLKNEVDEGTRFSVLSASGNIAKGVIENKDLLLVAPLFQAKGEGKVDLPQSKLKYTVALARPPKEETERTYVPLEIKGPFDDLSFKLALDDVARQRAKAELEKKQAELKAKAEEEKERLKKQAEAEKAKLKEKLEKEKAKATDKLIEKLDEKLKDSGDVRELLEKQVGDKLNELLK